MITDNLSTKLAIGAAACGLALVIGGVRLYRRNRARRVERASENDTQVEARTGDQDPIPGEDQPNGPGSQGNMPANASRKNLPWEYFGLLTALTVPLYLLGERKLPLPVNLPASALAFFSSFATAVIIAYRYDGSQGIKELLKKAVDFKKIEKKIWYMPSLFLAPAIYALSYLIMRWLGRPLPEPEFSFLVALPLSIGFLVEAPLEELGFMGLVIDPCRSGGEP